MTRTTNDRLLNILIYLIVISVLIFDLKESGDLGAIAVLGIAMLLITFAVVIAVNRIPGFGISHRRYN